MHKLVACFLLMCLLFIGCSESANKYQYFQKAMTFLDSGNINGAIIAFKKAIDKDQNYFEARFNLALAYIRQEKFESAEIELLKVIRLNPFFNEAHLSLAKIYVNVKKNDEAIKQVNNYLENEEGTPLAFDLLAMAYAAKKEYDEAEKYINKSLALFPHRLDTKILLADICISAGKIREAERLVDEILSIEEGHEVALFLLANIKNKKQDMEGMIDTYNRLLDTDPDNVRALVELGLVYIKSEKLLEAKEIAEKLQADHKKRPEGMYLMGILLFLEDKTDESISLLKEVVNKSFIPSAYQYLGLSYLKKGELDLAASAFREITDTHHDDIQAHMLLAITYLKKGWGENAIREAQQILKLDNNNAYAHNILGNTYLSLGKGDLAMKEFDKAIENDPGIVDAYMKKGMFNLMSGDKLLAEKELMSAVQIAPELLNPKIVLAQYYLWNKKYHEAINLLKQGLKSTSEDAPLLNLIGEALIGIGKEEKAIKYFEKAISYRPGFFLPYNNIALLHLKAGNKKEGINQYERILEVDDGNVPALLTLAKILESDDKKIEALIYYSRAAKQKDPTALIAIAAYYIRNNNVEEAERVAQEIIAAIPNRETGYQILAEVYMETQDFENAVHNLKKALKLNPKSLQTLAALGKTYVLNKDYKKARAIVDAIDKYQPQYAHHYYLQAKILELIGEQENAIEKYKQALALSDNHVASLNNLAYLYAEGYGPIEDALKMAVKAKKIAPRDGSITDTLGWIFFKMGNYDKALKYFKEAVGYLPEEPGIHYHLGFTFFKKGFDEQAAEHLHYALSFAPQSYAINSEQIQTVLNEIE